MKFRNCFIDNEGNVWKTETLIKAVKDIEAVPFTITDDHFDLCPLWQITNMYDHLVHHKRVLNADLSEPIILRSDGFILDGWHRLLKAMNTGEQLMSKTLPKMPLPDFTTT